METVIIAVGSNLGDRLEAIRKAGSFLAGLSRSEIQKASIYESEPIGNAQFPFLNSAARIRTVLSPEELLNELKGFEHLAGREKNPVRWGPRILDLDIIRYGDLQQKTLRLTLPHPEYFKRAFVLLPMMEIDAGWIDPELNLSLPQLLDSLPESDIQKTDHRW
ncbi:MAG: 2-amino-4-hydroxy-6-hydroxymethyldihydropteridine diphosphokinase [Balneolaceae bacterium]|nr:MAG: 2-amino-4-hydroxy-6-hydroxymethyldihydropteridine diphosphokinase [Balneolaceae bacterium]